MAIRNCWSGDVDRTNNSTPAWDANRTNGLTRVSTGFNLITNVSRWAGQYSLGLDHDNSVRGFREDIGGTETKMGVCFAFMITVSNTAATVFGFNEGTTRHVDLRRNASGALDVTRNGTVLGSGTTVFSSGVWHHVEFYVEISDTVGVAKVWVDGVLEINLTGQDTKNGGTGFIDRWECLGTATPNSVSRWNYTDIVIYDTTGGMAAPLGDLRVATIRPTGNGNSSQFTGSDGNSTDNYLLVDEVAVNDDTDYVESSTVGQKDTYAFGDLTVAGTVYAVKLYPHARKDDAGMRKIVSVARLSGTEEDSAEKNLTAAFNTIPDLRLTKPGGGSWAVSDVNSAEFGVKVST